MKFQTKVQVPHYFLVIAITIGQGSMVETFAHMRSPFILSLIRGIDGLVAGTAVMIIVLAGLIISAAPDKYKSDNPQ